MPTPEMFRGGHRHKTHSRSRERVTPGGPPSSKRESTASAYLRAAHAYMLISMPTGTSTIFGAFQAILALLLEPDGLRPPTKIMRKEKFASEILEMFRHKTSARLCCIAEAD